MTKIMFIYWLNLTYDREINIISSLLHLALPSFLVSVQIGRGAVMNLEERKEELGIKAVTDCREETKEEAGHSGRFIYISRNRF